MGGEDWTTAEIRAAKRHLRSVEAVTQALAKHKAKGGEDSKEARVRVAAKTLRKATKGGR